MTGFYKATAQQIIGNLQNVLTARSYTDGFAYLTLLADCQYDAVLPEMRQPLLFSFIESLMSMALFVFERIVAGGKSYLYRSIREAVSGSNAQ